MNIITGFYTKDYHKHYPNLSRVQ